MRRRKLAVTVKDETTHLGEIRGAGLGVKVMYCVDVVLRICAGHHFLGCLTRRVEKEVHGEQGNYWTADEAADEKDDGDDGITTTIE